MLTDSAWNGVEEGGLGRRDGSNCGWVGMCGWEGGWGGLWCAALRRVGELLGAALLFSGDSSHGDKRGAAGCGVET